MTDTSSVAITHSTTEPQYPVTTVPLNSPALNGAVSDSVPPDEEEPYTIKCICAFQDDDGNTVFCEGCETWQHIECYYHGRDVPEVHNCVDCEPRTLDARRATERQRRLREQDDGGDRKTKRSGAKNQKKKPPKEHQQQQQQPQQQQQQQQPSPTDQVNGFHQRSESSGARDQPPAKRPKTHHHRSSGSISSLAGAAPALQPDARKRATTSMSPTKSLGPSIPLYSTEFLHLYERDQSHTDMDSNLFVNLHLAADLASWVKEPAALAQVANVSQSQIFTRTDAELDRSRWPVLSTESITDSTTDVDGIHPTWKILKTRDGVGKDGIVGEITGKIGLLRDYCLDPSNRWQELRHPEPFVFFHPQLPIYIDSRHEGSMLRYVRRSCRPNVTMKTYITNEVEYHFCFVAKEDIPAGSEITTMWYLDPQLFGSREDLVKQESSETNHAQDDPAICISNVLSHFGGCSCDPPPTCLLSNVDRRRHPKSSSDPGVKQANGKRRKTKSSKPTITPPAVSSRASSEAIKNPDDDDQDSRSVSGSARGQTRSRDLTPTLQASGDVAAGGAGGDTELSAREKRKIAAAEKKFQQLEQDQQATTQRKKKRTSGHTSQATPPAVAGSAAAPVYFTQGTSTKSLHLDTASPRQSRSPPSGMSPGPLAAGGLARQGSPRNVSGSSTPPVRSPLGRAQYVDSSMQTDPDGHDPPSTPVSRRPNFVPLTQRLLKRCHADRVRFEERSGASTPSSQPDITGLLGSPTSTTSGHHHQPTPPSGSIKGDTEMKDPESPTATYSTQPPREMELGDDTTASPDRDAPSPRSMRGSVKPPIPPPWPSTAAHNTRIPLNGFGANPRTPFGPPLIPPLSTAISPGPASSMSPPSAVERSSQAPTPTPGSGMIAPSPIKKKLSLGDYISRRGTLTTPTSEKTQAQATAMLPPQKSQPGPGPSSTDNEPSSSSVVDSADPPVKTDTKSDPEPVKQENPSSPDVTMKDAPESTNSTHIPSVNQ